VKKSLLAVVMLTCMGVSVSVVAGEASAGVEVAKGKMLYSADGKRLGSVYRVGDDGSAQLILDGKMRTVPAETLSVVDGKLTTSLSKKDVKAN
jgi:hypothetical protein